MAHFITSAYLKDKALAPLCDENYLDLVDEDIKAIALDFGVEASEIVVTPLDHRIKELAKCLLYVRICEDHGAIDKQAAALGVEIDIYAHKRKIYQQKATELKDRLTSWMFTGEADTPQERMGSVEIYRG